MHEAGQHHDALGQLRCLRHYMQLVGHQLPRALRTEGEAGGFAEGETVDLVDSDEEEEPKEAIDVESLEALLLVEQTPRQPVRIKEEPGAAAVAPPAAVTVQDDEDEELFADKTWQPAEWTKGYRCDARDTDGEWLAARVTRSRRVEGSEPERTEIRVRFIGWEARFDEWIDTASGKLAPLGTKSPDASQPETEDAEERAENTGPAAA